jgi:O-antigen ligase
MILLLVVITALAAAGVLYTAGYLPWVLGTLDDDLTLLLILWLTAVLFAAALDKIVLAGGPDLSPARIIWVLMILALFSRVVTWKTRLLPLTRTEIAMFAFLVLALTSKFLMQSSASDLTDQGISKLLNGYLFPFSMFFFGRQLARDEGTVRKVLVFLVWVGLYLSVTAVCEHFPVLNRLVLPPVIMDPNAGIHWGRARGPFLQAAVNGTVLGMVFPIALFLGLQERTRTALKRLCLATAGLIPVAVFFTYTRACWLGLFVAAGIMAAYLPKFRKVLLAVLVAGTIAGAVKWTIAASTGSGKGTERARDQASIYYRIYLTDISWRMIQERPLFGFGLDTFPHISYRFFRKLKGLPYFALRGLAHHNTFLVILVELGLFGLIALMLVYYYVIKNGVDDFRERSPGGTARKDQAVVFGAASAVFFLNMFFIDMRFFAFPNALFFILGGMIMGLRQSRVRGLPSPLPLTSAPARPASWPAGPPHPRLEP